MSKGPTLFDLGRPIPGARNNNGSRTSRHQATCQRHNNLMPARAKLGEALPWVAPDAPAIAKKPMRIVRNVYEVCRAESRAADGEQP